MKAILIPVMIWFALMPDFIPQFIINKLHARELKQQKIKRVQLLTDLNNSATNQIKEWSSNHKKECQEHQQIIFEIKSSLSKTTYYLPTVVLKGHFNADAYKKDTVTNYQEIESKYTHYINLCHLIYWTASVPYFIFILSILYNH